MHLQRCIDSIKAISSSILIVDSGSIDSTLEIADSNDCILVFNEWINYSSQFNFALNYCKNNLNSEWILRIDADEYLSSKAAQSISQVLTQNQSNISSLIMPRQIIFRGKRLRFGGVGNTFLLRVFRLSGSYCEHRWMDEHIVTTGRTVVIQAPFYDHNLNYIGWWINKHNSYSSREAVDMLLMRHKRSSMKTKDLRVSHRAYIVRLLKNNVYASMPALMRPLLYFIFRYIFLLGFLDGEKGFQFHFLQALWYREIVEIKIKEVESYKNKNHVSLATAISNVLSIDLAE
jgi:glycosyltransferase involved in cell wall biosynthesis